MGLEWSPRDRSSTMVRSRVEARRWSTAEPSNIDRKHRCRVARLSEAAIIATCIKTSLGRRGQSGCKRCGTFLFVWASCRRGLKLYRRSFGCSCPKGFWNAARRQGSWTSIPSRSIPPTRLLLTSCRRPRRTSATPWLSVGRTDEANLIGEVCAAADTIVPLLWNLDTTTDGDVVIDAGSAGPEPADNSADPFIAVCAPVRRLRSRFELALTHLRRRKGPEARLSLGLLVSQLCDLWRRETGQARHRQPRKAGLLHGPPTIGIRMLRVRGR